MYIPIKGWQKTSLIDFSPYTASVIFLGGCNFRCSYCHNPDLVLKCHEIKDIELQKILDYLKAKKNWIDGVCITGGEPTIYQDLPLFLAEFKKIGLKVKLDTNGTNPLMLKELTSRGVVDYIAMDIKNSLEKYAKVAIVEVDKDKIRESVDLIKNSGIDYEFRTTVIPGIVGKKEIFLIGKWMEGSKKFVIQNFRGDKGLIDNRLRDIKHYSKEDLNEMASEIQSFFQRVEVRE